MKATVLLLTMSCAALMYGASHEVASQPTSTSKNQPRSHARLTGANSPKQPPGRRKRPIPQNPVDLPPLRSEQSSGAAKGQFFQNKTGDNALPVRPKNVVRPTLASLHPLLNRSPSNVRHNGSASAFIGGSENSERRSSGTLNGTGMHHKP